MKIAGRKNDGAWYRTNKVLNGLDTEDRGNLATAIGSLETLIPAYNAIDDLCTSAGLTVASVFFDDPSLWASSLAHNVPRQTYMGILSFDIYDKTGTTGAYKYKSIHAQPFRLFAKDLRKLYKQFIFGRRELLDLQNQVPAVLGNPGGIADATKVT